MEILRVYRSVKRRDCCSPQAHSWNRQDFHCGEAVIHLPSEIGFTDLTENPSIYRKLQQNPRCTMTSGDRVRFISFHFNWIVDAVVTYADAERISLGNIRRVDLPKIADETAAHIVRWTRTGDGRCGFAVFEKGTGRMIAGPFANQVAAQAATPKPPVTQAATRAA